MTSCTVVKAGASKLLIQPAEIIKRSVLISEVEFLPLGMF